MRGTAGSKACASFMVSSYPAIRTTMRTAWHNDWLLRIIHRAVYRLPETSAV